MELTIPENWEPYGILTPAESAEVFEPMFDAICLERATCKVIGEIVPYAGNTSPKTNWLVCDGSEVLQSAFPDLYTVIGDTFGSAGVGYFKLPDLRGRSLAGSGTGSGLNQVTVGEYYGEQEHTLTVGEMPVHNHTDSGHSHTTGNSLTSAAVMPGEGPVLVPNPIPAYTGTASANIGNAGNGEAHNTVGPRLGITFLIVAKDG